MPNYVALLGGINLGNRRLKMVHLRQLFMEMQFERVETVLASGNVLFHSRRRARVSVETYIEERLQSALGYSVKTFVRDNRELAEIIDRCPFAPQRQMHGIQVLFYKQPLPEQTARVLCSIHTPHDRFAVFGRQAYWQVAGKMSDSQVWNSPELKSLALPSATMRNMNTLDKLLMAFGR